MNDLWFADLGALRAPSARYEGCIEPRLVKVLSTIALILALMTAPAFAYTTRKSNGGACTTDSACHVYCDNGVLAGTMYWNGSRWADGVRSDPDKDVVARQIVAAQGGSCR